jgi:radical SAM protein with 4Fe4S-binding SPASM domain
LNEVRERFPRKAPLIVYPHQINVAYSHEYERREAEAWYNEKCFELEGMASDAGLYKNQTDELPSLCHEMCGAANGYWRVITPSGGIACCGEQIGDDQLIGSVRQGVTNWELAEKWKRFADDERCHSCVMFPRCAKMLFCKAATGCYHKKVVVQRSEDLIYEKYNQWLSRMK